jgi:hypothetical protein
VAVDQTKLTTPVKTDDGEVTEAVSKLTWTAAAGAAIKPGQFQEFDVSAGPLPKVDKLVFKALQTYSDGDVVRWIEEPAANGKEPEHPAPTLKLTAAAAADTGAVTPTTTAAGTTTTSGGSSPTTALVVAIIGLVVGLAGLTVGLLAYRRTTAHRS